MRFEKSLPDSDAEKQDMIKNSTFPNWMIVQSGVHQTSNQLGQQFIDETHNETQAQDSYQVMLEGPSPWSAENNQGSSKPVTKQAKPTKQAVLI